MNLCSTPFAQMQKSKKAIAYRLFYFGEANEHSQKSVCSLNQSLQDANFAVGCQFSVDGGRASP
jgi:hypothetical protein